MAAIFLLYFVAQVVFLHHHRAMVLFFPVYTLNIALLAAK